MTEPVELDATLTPLIRRMCDAGELDLAVSLIDFLQAQGASGKSLVPLRAQAFLCEEGSPERRREALRGTRSASLDLLARAGALRLCAALYKLLAEAFTDDRIWRRKLRRIELVLSPLPGADADTEQASVTELLMADRAREALTVLRAIARKHPEDPRLKQRFEELQGLLFEPASTRPYRILSPEETERLSQPPEPEVMDPLRARETVLKALLQGDLSGAEPAARALAASMPHEGTGRVAEAIARLAAIQRAESVSTPSDEVTLRLSPAAIVDLWVRQGMLSRALDQARELASRPENKAAASALAERLGDLERVLAMIPSPDASGAPDERATTEFAVLRELSTQEISPVVPIPEPPPVTSPLTEPPPVTSPLTEPPPVAPARTKVARRKVVRLG